MVHRLRRRVCPVALDAMERTPLASTNRPVVAAPLPWLDVGQGPRSARVRLHCPPESGVACGRVNLGKDIPRNGQGKTPDFPGLVLFVKPRNFPRISHRAAHCPRTVAERHLRRGCIRPVCPTERPFPRPSSRRSCATIRAKRTPGTRICGHRKWTRLRHFRSFFRISPEMGWTCQPKSTILLIPGPLFPLTQNPPLNPKAGLVNRFAVCRRVLRQRKHRQEGRAVEEHQGTRNQTGSAHSRKMKREMISFAC